MGDIIEGMIDGLRALVASELSSRLIDPEAYDHADGGPPGDLPGPGPRFALPWPKPGTDPRLAAAWEELMAWPLPSRDDAIPINHDADTRHGFAGASNSGAAAGAAERSPNWSGAVALPSGGRRFSAIAARWRVPGATRPDGATYPLPRRDIPPKPSLVAGEAPRLPQSWRCSVWVGLDGYRAASDSLPQIGTTVVVEVDEHGQEQVRAHAWAQWWVRDKQYGEMRFEDFDLQPGDTVTAWLAMQSDQVALLRIRNERTGRIGSAAWRSGTRATGGAEADAARAAATAGAAEQEQQEQQDEGGIRLMQVHAERAPAEGAAAAWVVERPMVMLSHELYPLPRFEPVEFHSCIAALRDPGDHWGSAARLVDLGGARLIRMFEQRGRPYRSRNCAAPMRAADGTRMTVGYCG